MSKGLRASFQFFECLPLNLRTYMCRDHVLQPSWCARRCVEEQVSHLRSLAIKAHCLERAAFCACVLMHDPKVIPSKLFAYDGSINLTLQSLQGHLVRMLNVISKPDPQLGGWSVRYLAGKGDQKYKVEWLLEKRNYLHLSLGGGEICRRCFAGRRDRPWLDFFGLPFNQPEEVEAATMSSLSAQSCKSACVQKARIHHLRL